MSVPYPETKSTFYVYGIHTCPYCQRAKQAIQNVPKSKYVDITPYKNEVIQHFREVGLIPHGHRTVPLVFKNGVFLGGSSELLRLLQMT